MSNRPTRRSLLGAMAIAPLATSLATPSVAADHTVWSIALARAVAADDRYGSVAAAEEDARQRWHADCRAIQPPGLIDRKWASLNNQLHTCPLDELASLYEPPFAGEFGDGAAIAAAVGHYRKKRQELHRRLRIDEHGEAVVQAREEWQQAYDTAVEMPVPTIAALVQKVEMIIHQTAACDELEPLLADARRLAGMEAQS